MSLVLGSLPRTGPAVDQILHAPAQRRGRTDGVALPACPATTVQIPVPTKTAAGLISLAEIRQEPCSARVRTPWQGSTCDASLRRCRQSVDRQVFGARCPRPYKARNLRSAPLTALYRTWSHLARGACCTQRVEAGVRPPGRPSLTVRDHFARGQDCHGDGGRTGHWSGGRG